MTISVVFFGLHRRSAGAEARGLEFYKEIRLYVIRLEEVVIEVVLVVAAAAVLQTRVARRFSYQSELKVATVHMYIASASSNPDIKIHKYLQKQ